VALTVDEASSPRRVSPSADSRPSGARRGVLIVAHGRSLMRILIAGLVPSGGDTCATWWRWANATSSLLRTHRSSLPTAIWRASGRDRPRGALARRPTPCGVQSTSLHLDVAIPRRGQAAISSSRSLSAIRWTGGRTPRGQEGQQSTDPRRLPVSVHPMLRRLRSLLGAGNR